MNPLTRSITAVAGAILPTWAAHPAAGWSWLIWIALVSSCAGGICLF